MARAPIIISNGGIVGELAKGFFLQKKAEKKIMKNIRRLRDLDSDKKTSYTVATWIKSNNNKAPRIIWHLKKETEQNREKLVKFLRKWGDDDADLGDEVVSK